MHEDALSNPRVMMTGGVSAEECLQQRRCTKGGCTRWRKRTSEGCRGVRVRGKTAEWHGRPGVRCNEEGQRLVAVVEHELGARHGFASERPLAELLF